MFGEGGGMGGWMGSGMWLFWIVLIVIVVLLLRAVSGGASSSSPSRQDTPLEILKARYARGEIDDEEFQHRRRELEK
jgi:putative membrane protein